MHRPFGIQAHLCCIGLAFLALGLAAQIRQASSQPQPADQSRMQTFMRSDFFKGLIDRSLARLPETVFKKCSTLVSTGSTVTVLKPITFAADGYPNAGLWLERFPVSGCGNDTVLNLYFSAGADEKINTIVAVPGDSRADLTLQQDAVKYADIGAMVVVKDCKAFSVANTKFEGFGLRNPATPDPGPSERRRPWWETWTLVGCGRKIDLPMDFVPQERGTNIIQPGGGVER